MVTTVNAAVSPSNDTSLQNETVKPSYYLSTVASTLDERSVVKDASHLMKSFNINGLSKDFGDESVTVDEIGDGISGSEGGRDIDDDEETLKIDQGRYLCI